MKKLLWSLLFCIPAAAQVVGPSGIGIVSSAPSGTCTAGSLGQLVASTGTIYTCQSGTWAVATGGGGSGTVSNQATGIVPLGTSANAISNQSHLDDGQTVTGSITSSEPVNVTSANAAKAYQFNGQTIAAFPQDQSTNYSTFYGVGSGTGNNVTTITKNLSTCFGANTCGSAGAGMSGTQPELVGVGWGALSLITTGINDTAVGVGAMRYETTGVGNAALGTDAMGQSVGVTSSVAVGSGAVKSGADTDVVGIGAGALQGQSTSTAQNDVAVGYAAMTSLVLTTAQGDVAIGYSALGGSGVTSAQNDVAIGSNAMNNSSLTAASYDTAVGSNALQHVTGNSNTALGNGAGSALTSGAGNIAIGINAGATTMATGSNNLLIGSNSVDTAAAGDNNETVINGTTGNGSNTVTIGSSAVTKNYFSGQILAGGYTSNGTTFSVAGCGTATSLIGGSTAGKFVGGSATCTPVVTMGGSFTAANGFSCSMTDMTTATAAFRETAYTTTTATFTAGGTVGATDTIVFGCEAF